MTLLGNVVEVVEHWKQHSRRMSLFRFLSGILKSVLVVVIENQSQYHVLPLRSVENSLRKKKFKKKKETANLKSTGRSLIMTHWIQLLESGSLLPYFHCVNRNVEVQKKIHAFSEPVFQSRDIP